MTDEGGDPACWADRVCERCGLIVEEDGEHVCPLEERPKGAIDR